MTDAWRRPVRLGSTVSIYLSAADLEYAQLLADAEGLTLGRWLKRAVSRELERAETAAKS